MLEKFEALINANSLDDYWYDVALFSCQEIIIGFSDAEWKQLFERIDVYSERSKIRIAECLADIDNKNSLYMIIKLSNTKSHDLFVTCIDSLRDMDMSCLSSGEKADFLQKVRDFSVNASELEKAVLNAFCNSISI